MRITVARVVVLVAVAALAGCEVARREVPRPLDGRMARVWPAAHAWDAHYEREYSAFVARLGAAVQARRCDRLDACLADPQANLLYDPETDAGMHLDIDCADLPYALRAYYSFKRQLPFGFVSRIHGFWFDPRFAVGAEPVEWRTWRDYRTPRVLLHEMTREVHSGMYRLAAAVETGDFYPVKVDRQSVVPGSVFYDPYGHVSVVARVREDGVVHLLAGSPDGMLTWKRFGSGFSVGSPPLGGGFKRFRPVKLQGATLVRVRNEDLPDFDGRTQYQVARSGADFPRWVRESLAAPGVIFDPVADLRDQTRSLCRDVNDRIIAVDLAVEKGIADRRHPSRLPENIYTTSGVWEDYATPARDARLKASFRDLAETVLEVDDLRAMGPVLRQAWDEVVASPACQMEYRNSAGEMVPITLDEVLDRLFELSFDPYNCPELRWGAPEGSRELATCPDGKRKRAWYRAEQRLRYRIERSYGLPTPVDSGPDGPPAIDVRKLFGPRPPDLNL